MAPEGNIMFKENFNDKDLKYGTMTQSKDEVIISSLQLLSNYLISNRAFLDKLIIVVMT